MNHKRSYALLLAAVMVMLLTAPVHAETIGTPTVKVKDGVAETATDSSTAVLQATGSMYQRATGSTASPSATDSEADPLATDSLASPSQRVYTKEDWDKWRVEYKRINSRPYGESDTEKKIYSYNQLPVNDTGRVKWAGDWSAIEEGGKPFSNFGCGICCLSNIYSTFVQRPVDPGQMLSVAKEYTTYDPAGKYGAIDWPQMKTLCEKLGMTAELKRKPDDYAQFQKDVQNADATVVLVCKDNDPSLWFYTNGHYVTLWEYDPSDDTVYVTDSSGLFNRERVFLRDVYAALKTRSSYQYMCVDADILGFRTLDTN